jgi:ribonucleoside-diphosphate reductase alpha chain
MTIHQNKASANRSEETMETIENQQQGTKNPTPFVTPALSVGTLKVIKRNGMTVPYDETKIKVAINKAFIAVEGQAAAASNRIFQQLDQLTAHITETFIRRMPAGGSIHIEEIQDQAELVLMRGGAYQVARSYVLYREERRKARQATQAAAAEDSTTLLITMPNGELQPLDPKWLTAIVEEACANLSDVSADAVAQEALRNLYHQAKLEDVYKALIMASRTFIETEPNYSQVSARLLLNTLRQEAFALLKQPAPVSQEDMAQQYPAYFHQYIQHGIQQGLLDSTLLDFDLKKLGEALQPERDLEFTYLGLQTLYDRYFIHDQGQRYELPQAFFMRVAMGLAMREKQKEHWAIQFYQLLSSFDYMASTPTLFNSGTIRPQLSSCYLTTVPDRLDAIYNAIKDNALLSKFAGGLGNDWTPVRAMGSHIKGTNGKSQGVVPFLNVANATAVAVNQGGKRKGAVCAYLECWHRDVEEFLELRKNTGDDRRRTHDMNTAVWIPDLFMKRVAAQGNWTLFSPEETPDLHDLYGTAFDKRYQEYEVMAEKGQVKNTKTLPALQLWRKMLSMLFETGHPWLTFKDACNLRSPQQHAGVIHSSNLCT